MSTTPRGGIHSLLIVLTLLVSCGLLAACSGATHPVSKDGGGTTARSGDSAMGQALAYSRCMRSHGISSFPDPTQDSLGRIALQPAQGVDPNSPAFQAAASACQSLDPQGSTGDTAGGHALDPSKVAAWAACIRKHGLPDFQDPEVNGDSLLIDAGAAGISGPQDPTFAKAAQACYSIRPGGMLGFIGGTPQ